MFILVLGMKVSFDLVVTASQLFEGFYCFVWVFPSSLRPETGEEEPHTAVQAGTKWLESNFAEEDLGQQVVWVDNRLNMSQQYAFAAKPTTFWAALDRALLVGQGRWSFPSLAL